MILWVISLLVALYVIILVWYVASQIAPLENSEEWLSLGNRYRKSGDDGTKTYSCSILTVFLRLNLLN